MRGEPIGCWLNIPHLGACLIAQMLGLLSLRRMRKFNFETTTLPVITHIIVPAVKLPNLCIFSGQHAASLAQGSGGIGIGGSGLGSLAAGALGENADQTDLHLLLLLLVMMKFLTLTGSHSVGWLTPK